MSETQTWWMIRLSGFTNRIEPVKVIRATGLSIWIEGRRGRCPIHSSWENYYPTAHQAADALNEYWSNRVKSAELQLEQLNKFAPKQKELARECAEYTAAFLKEQEKS